MNKKQFSLIVRRRVSDPARQNAVYDVIFNNVSIYATEFKYEIPQGTLGRLVRKIKLDWNFIEQVIEAGD